MTHPRSAALAALVVVAALAAAGCSGGAEASGDVADGPGSADAVGLVAVDSEFEPITLELPAGERVEVEVTNEGAATHDFTIDELQLSTGPIGGGAVATASFVVPDGETAFVCSLHAGMDGTIVGT